ncbi:MAG: PQQ-like beta-propeller repeat protein [Candidatus Hydrogenedentes bacterium]|nr:PQQ-like beta-propeller repeat protein [Candidatus Hydrogenedentota bacterium]
MSDPTDEHEESVSAEEPARGPGPETPSAPVRLNVVPAVIIVAAHMIVLAFTVTLPTVFGNAVGIVVMPILAALLLAIWWLGFSRAPWRDRIAGLGIFVAVVAWTVVTQPQYQARILSVSLPVLTTGIVAVLAATMWSAWPAQRTKALLYMIACAVIFPLFRIDDVGGNLAPNMSWRWSAPPKLAVDNPGGSAALPEKPGPLDWPAFRGPQRDGVARGVAIATNWNEQLPKELWRNPVGLGFSSFCAIGGYVFTQEQRGDTEVVVCYEAGSGDEVWINGLKARFDEAVGSGPRATPTFDSGKLYTQGATGILQCLNAATGEQVWQADVAKDTTANVPEWGFSSSPLVTDKFVVMYTGGVSDSRQEFGAENDAVIAYDKSTGAKVWCSGASAPGYSSAHLADLGGVQQIVMTSGFGVQSFDPTTGALLWENKWPIRMNPRVVQPMIVDGGRAVLVGTAEGKGTRYLQVALNEAKWNVTEKWTTREFRPYFNDYVLHKGYCYGFDGNTLMCIDSATGYRRWKGGRYGGQLLLIENSNVLIVLSEKGELALVRTNPSEFEEIARFQALTGKTWNHPVVANGKLFVRNAEEMACFELPG